MENSELISIVIPVYNTEKYLKKCVNSILNQTYCNLDIILVDDGSTDNSGKICDELTKADKRIRVFHKENSGVSASRNLGIMEAKGKYIGFVDSDDFIEADMYKILYENMIKYNLDISICNCYTVTNKEKFYDDHKIKDKILLINNNKYFYKLLHQDYFKYALWNKLYKTEKIKKYMINNEVHMGEDLLLLAQVAKDCNMFGLDDRPLYNYVIRKGSITNSKFNEKNLSVMYAYDNVVEIINKYASEERFWYILSEYYALNDILIKGKFHKYSNKKVYKEKNKNLYKEIMASNKLTINKRILCFLEYRMWIVYVIFIKIKSRINNLKNDRGKDGRISINYNSDI